MLGESPARSSAHSCCASCASSLVTAGNSPASQSGRVIAYIPVNLFVTDFQSAACKNHTTPTIASDDKQMLFAPGPRQRFPNFLFALLAARIPKRCQHLRVSLSRYDRADDGLSLSRPSHRSRLAITARSFATTPSACVGCAALDAPAIARDAAAASAAPPGLLADETNFPTIHNCAGSGSTAHLRCRSSALPLSATSAN